MNAPKRSSRSFMTCLVPADRLSIARLVLCFSKSSQTWDIGKYEGILRLCILLIRGHSIDGTGSGLWRVQVTAHPGHVGPMTHECLSLSLPLYQEVPLGNGSSHAGLPGLRMLIWPGTLLTVDATPPCMGIAKTGLCVTSGTWELTTLLGCYWYLLSTSYTCKVHFIHIHGVFHTLYAVDGHKDATLT